MYSNLLKYSFFLYSLFFILLFPVSYLLSKNLYVTILIFIIFVVIIEIVFRVAWKLRCGYSYTFFPKIPFKKIYIEPHPYLPYVYKKNFLGQKAQAATYPLNNEKEYAFPELYTNNVRHINGSKGNRNIEMPKPNDLFRIICLGASTTGNYLQYQDATYSYPLALEKILQEKIPDRKIEVNNCGQGGYTSAEILIKFLLDTIDTKPDMVVIYHAYNDLGPSLTSGFSSDYSHSRINFAHKYQNYKLSQIFPHIPLASYNFTLNQFVSQNPRNTLLNEITLLEPDLDNCFQGLDTYKRNLEHIIHICKANSIKVVISTFCFHFYDEVKNSKKYNKYYEGLQQENDVIRHLSEKHDLFFVDNAKLIPSEKENFVDCIHFSHAGMQLLAKNLSVPIEKYLTKTL